MRLYYFVISPQWGSVVNTSTVQDEFHSSLPVHESLRITVANEEGHPVHILHLITECVNIRFE